MRNLSFRACHILFLIALSCGSQHVLKAEEIANTFDVTQHLIAGLDATLPERLQVEENCQVGSVEALEADVQPLEARVNGLLPCVHPQALNDKTQQSLINCSIYGAVYYILSHPGAVHTPFAIAPLGETLQLEDRSIWAIRSSDIYKVINWLSTDQIIIIQNEEVFSFYSFKLHNQTNGEAVAANLKLFLSPVYHSFLNYRVIDFNPVSKIVQLSDGSLWSVTNWDSIYSWKRGDTVIIGINTDWLSGDYPELLINANLLQYVRSSWLH